MSLHDLPPWFLPAFLALVLGFMLLGLIALAIKVLGVEFHHFIDALRSELRDAINRTITVGSINWYGFVAILIFGVVVIACSGLQRVFGMLLLFLSEEKAKELIEAANYFTLFYFSVAFLVVSLICVTIDSGRK